MKPRFYDDDETKYEDVAQFVVAMRWSPEYYGGDTPMTPGLDTVRIVIEGVATTTQAIEAAKAILKPIREDEPMETKVDLRTSKRRLPKQIGQGSTL